MKIIPKALVVCILASTSYFTQAQNDIIVDNSSFYIRVSTGYSFESGKSEFNNADPNGLTGIMQSTDVTIMQTVPQST